MSGFKIIGLFTIFIIGGFSSFKPLKAETYIPNKITITEILAEGPDFEPCDSDNMTRWDWELENSNKLYKGDLISCRESDPSKTERECLAAGEKRWPENIRHYLEDILEKYQTYLRESKNPYHVVEWLNHLKEMVRRRVYNLLVQRDAFENTEVFDELFDQAILKIENNIPPLNINQDEPYKKRWIEQKKWASDLLKTDKSLLSEIQSMRSYDPGIPYGRNACRQAPKASSELNSKTLSECFLNQESFLASVKFDRKNEIYCGGESPKKICPSVVHGVKAASLKPCGNVIGTWQAKTNGTLVFSNLKIIPRDQSTPVAFDSNVLKQIIRKTDQDLKLSQNVSNGSSSPITTDNFEDSNPK